MGTTTDGAGRPPSVDSLARDLARSVPLPHAVLVDCARSAIASGAADPRSAAAESAVAFGNSLIGDVVNATGVLLHTNLGRAPLPHVSTGRASNVEFDMEDGSRGSRHSAVAGLVRILTGAEDAVVVNNNAAAVMLVLAALARGRGVAVSRGESVEIGGGFRVPEVMEQSGARIVDVGTTNRTNAADYAAAVGETRNDVALVMKVHPSNFSVRGFVSSADVSELCGLGVPVVSDIGSGLLDSSCPWLHGRTDGVPQFLRDEPAASVWRAPVRDHRRPRRSHREVRAPSADAGAPAGFPHARHAPGGTDVVRVTNRMRRAPVLADAHGTHRLARVASTRSGVRVGPGTRRCVRRARGCGLRTRNDHRVQGGGDRR